MTECFYDKKNYPAYRLLKDYRKELLHNKEKITVTDLGAGSKVFGSSERKISDIAKNAGVSSKRAKFLYRLNNYLNCRNSLELGTSLGMGTCALAANLTTQVTSIEGCPETARIAKEEFERFGLKNTNLKIGEFDKVLEGLLQQGTDKKFDLVYFDGNHQKEATLKYFEALLPFAHNDSVFIFDDIHWSPGMEKAWEEIRKSPSVKVTIDTFYQGLVFFRREQAKQHFRIRL